MQRGFTLIEAMIAIGLIAIITAVVLPGYQGFLSGKKVTATANNIYVGAQLARAYAISNNTQASLVINDKSWCIYDRGQNDADVDCDATSNTLAGGLVRKGIDSSNSTVDTNVSPIGAFQVTYNSLGQIIENPNSADPRLETFTVTLSTDTSKSMRVLLANGIIRMCNPLAPPGSPQGC
jgi:type IV fimbrial biogenesis protein FimT